MSGREAFGYLLAVVGGLGLAFSGLCTLSFGGLALVGYIGTGGREAGDYLGAALMVGVPPIVVCWGLLVIGRRLIGVGKGRAVEGGPPAGPPADAAGARRHGADDTRRGDERDDDDPWLSS